MTKGVRGFEASPTLTRLVDDMKTGVAEAIGYQDQANHLLEHSRIARALAGQTHNAAIQEASRNLIRLASEDTTIGDRDLLIAALYLNQHKPTDVIWSGPPNIPRSMEVYDNLAPGAPALLRATDTHYFDNSAPMPVLISRKSSVSIAEARGMGGLPEAQITFGIQRLRRGEDYKPSLDDEESLTITHHELRSAKIGAAAIQKFLDAQEFIAQEKTCYVSTNIETIKGTKNAAQLLMEATGIELNTTHIDGLALQATTELNRLNVRRVTRSAKIARRRIRMF